MEVKKHFYLAIFAIVFISHCASTGKTVKPVVKNESGTYNYYRDILPAEEQAIERFLREKLPEMKGRKVCLISNQAGMGRLLYLPGRAGQPTGLHYRFKQAGADLYKVFTPEHGLSAVETAHGNTAKKEKFYLKTIYFLNVAQIAKLFHGCQDMIYSLPDASVRPFTYRTIFTRTIRAFNLNRGNKAAKSRYYFIDVPNPGAHMQSLGPVAKEFSYLGEEEIPFFPGYTFGELAKYFHSRHKLKVRLKVSPLVAYSPDSHFLQSNQPYIQPSPNLPTFRSMQCYWAAVFLEGNLIDIGRNSNDPFCLLGHPAFKSHLKPADGNGVTWQSYNYIPWGGKFKGELVTAYRMRIRAPDQYQPVKVAYNFIRFMQKKYPQIKLWRVSKTGVYWLDKLTGNKSMRKALQKGKSFDSWYETNKKDVSHFREVMQAYKIY